MSDEVLIFTDAHVHPHKRKTERMEDCLKAVDWVFETARNRGITDILFGGDLLHDRQKIEVYTYQRLYETLARNLVGDIRLWLLLGNHDLWFNDNTSISSVVPFSSLPGVTIVDQPTRMHNISGSSWDFIPFTHDPISTLQELKKKGGKAEFCLGHIAIDGAVLHGEHTSDVLIEHDGDMMRVSADLFSHYKNVFLGHYHAAQQLTPVVEYVGSPLELSFGEAGQKKHILAFNVQTRKKTYIENTFSPKHMVIRPKDVGKKQNLDGNFVRLMVDEIGATDLIQLRKELTDKHDFGSLEIKQQKKKLEEHVIQDAKAILFKEDEMLSKYVDEVGSDGLDRDLLLKIGREICDNTIT